MPLTQFDVSVDESLAEELSSFLEDEALSLTWYEATPDQWVFQAACDPAEATAFHQKIARFFKEKGLARPHIASYPLEEEDWVAAVHRDSPPLTIGRFYIYGSHIQEDPPPGLLPLRVDAATAFGSGQHESTEGCLKALTLLAERQSFHHPLDMGCGSGILGLAMARLWNVPVVACDNDPECVRVSLENARLNQLDLTASLSDGFTSLKGQKFDIITANILAGPLCHMAREASSALTPGGYIILAGLLNRQAKDVIEAYESVSLKLMTQLFIGDWSTLIMRKEAYG